MAAQQQQKLEVLGALQVVELMEISLEEQEEQQAEVERLIWLREEVL
tara:strand:+ start:568 stop:708 length:141 start_codon:yes stop_codon:yes gene_type:complete